MDNNALENAPLGSVAPSMFGGAWFKIDRGWQWNGHCNHGGSTFSKPGGDWNGQILSLKEYLSQEAIQ